MPEALLYDLVNIALSYYLFNFYKIDNFFFIQLLAR